MIIIVYYIGVIVGVGITVFTSYLFYKKFQIEQKQANQNYQDYLIQFKKVKDLHTYYTS